MPAVKYSVFVGTFSDPVGNFRSHSPGMLMGLPWVSRSAPMKRHWFREELSTSDVLLLLAELVSLRA